MYNMQNMTDRDTCTDNDYFHVIPTWKQLILIMPLSNPPPVLKYEKVYA